MQSSMLEKAKEVKAVKSEKKVPMAVQSAKFIQKEKMKVIVTINGKEMTMEEL